MVHRIGAPLSYTLPCSRGCSAVDFTTFFSTPWLIDSRVFMVDGSGLFAKGNRISRKQWLIGLGLG